MSLSDNRVSSILSSIEIVMVNTTLPANIGSAARAMHTMGLSHLTVVAPKLPIDDTSVAHAAGGKSILDNCLMTETIDDAIQHSQLVFAASSRNRHIPRPVVTPTQAANIIRDFINPSQSSLNQSRQPTDQECAPHNKPKVAILFGREDRGLTNDELARADYHIQIDANPDYPVLNVASAIQVIASFLYANFIANAKDDALNNDTDNRHTTSGHTTSDGSVNIIEHHIRQQWDAPPVTQQQQQELQHRIIELMEKLNLVEDTSPAKLRDLPNRLSRFSSRLQLDQKEYELLNAIIAKMKRKT